MNLRKCQAEWLGQWCWTDVKLRESVNSKNQWNLVSVMSKTIGIKWMSGWAYVIWCEIEWMRVWKNMKLDQCDGGKMWGWKLWNSMKMIVRGCEVVMLFISVSRNLSAFFFWFVYVNLIVFTFDLGTRIFQMRVGIPEAGTVIAGKNICSAVQCPQFCWITTSADCGTMLMLWGRKREWGKLGNGSASESGRWSFCGPNILILGRMNHFFFGGSVVWTCPIGLGIDLRIQLLKSLGCIRPYVHWILDSLP